eukprot:m.76349 g.76349  ORF g.76349 m.76349 type:complete len:96 (+) comp50453_c0_seq2:1325-1612(+)
MPLCTIVHIALLQPLRPNTCPSLQSTSPPSVASAQTAQEEHRGIDKAGKNTIEWCRWVGKREYNDTHTPLASDSTCICARAQQQQVSQQKRERTW